MYNPVSAALPDQPAAPGNPARCLSERRYHEVPFRRKTLRDARLRGGELQGVPAGPQLRAAQDLGRSSVSVDPT